MNQAQFATNLKKLRTKHNLTQKEFADRLGVTYQAVSKWERGINMPDITLLQEIAKIFNIKVDELLTGNKSSNNNKYKLLLIILISLILLIMGFLLSKAIAQNNNFKFMTITSDCNEFTLTGSAAYNKDKTSLYITNIDYCGTEDNTIYQKIECNLYEEYKAKINKIGTCGNKTKETTLNNFLNDININVNNYKASCKMFSSSNIFLEIKAYNNEHKIITYKVPLKLDENC